MTGFCAEVHETSTARPSDRGKGSSQFVEFNSLKGRHGINHGGHRHEYFTSKFIDFVVYSFYITLGCIFSFQCFITLRYPKTSFSVFWSCIKIGFRRPVVFPCQYCISLVQRLCYATWGDDSRNPGQKRLFCPTRKGVMRSDLKGPRPIESLGL